MEPADNPIDALNAKVEEANTLTIFKTTDKEQNYCLHSVCEQVRLEKLLPREYATINQSADELALMEQTLEFVSNKENGAAGMAAPQVGSNLCWFVMKMGRESKPVIIVNPDIIGRSGRKQHVEGCFSETNRAQVKRSRDITVSYFTVQQDNEGKWTKQYHKLVKLEGWDAQVFQHEYDHLRGVLICEKKGAKVIYDEA